MYFRVKSYLRKLKPRNFAVHDSTCELNEPLFNPQPTANKSVSASVPLTAFAEAIRNVSHVSTDAQTRQRRKCESGSNRYYERPGYEATVLAALEQRAEIAISL